MQSCPLQLNKMGNSAPLTEIKIKRSICTDAVQSTATAPGRARLPPATY